ncbi:MAG TPA: YceI family protein [Thermoanaerobaculia bacterium]|nr:YceI family protein [Thermoanaerobaculia bacterium]
MRTKMLVQALAVTFLLPVLEKTMAAEPIAYKADPAHSYVGFAIRHFLTDVNGRFTQFDGAIKYDPQNPSASSVQFTVQAASINTQVEDRDKHLRSPDFFDAQKFPTLSFTSTSVSAKDPKNIEVTGNLTIHGVTKQVTVPATYLGSLKTQMGERAGFKASFTINRMDYGVAWNRAIEGGGAMLGDDVTVTVNLEAPRLQAAAPAPK